MIECVWCKKPITLDEPHTILGDVSVHDDCLVQWKKEDPLEWAEEAA